MRLKGYTILARRFRAGAGEIDLIAARGDVIAFVEVKARRQMDDARAAITLDKQRRIASAARIWLARNPAAMTQTLRLDAIFIGALSWTALRNGALLAPRHEANIAPLLL